MQTFLHVNSTLYKWRLLERGRCALWFHFHGKAFPFSSTSIHECCASINTALVGLLKIETGRHHKPYKKIL